VQLARATDSRLSKIAQDLSYFPSKLWSGLRDTLDEVQLVNVKLKLREKLRPHWQESGEELFRSIADSKIAIVFVLDEFPMMIDRMARSEINRQDAKTMLHWLRTLRQTPETRDVRFFIAGSIGIGRVLNELGEINAINDFEQLRLGPFSLKTAAAFLDELAKPQKIELSQPSKLKLLELIGSPVPYFIQILFSEVIKAHRLDDEQITPELVEQVYHDKVIGVDCKTYFDHYYTRLRDYYQPQEEKAIKRILREVAAVGQVTRDACYQFYLDKMGGQADVEEFNLSMTDLENDFYLRFNSEERKYEFACKLLRDWWLRHYGMETSN
jgi:hypothetical protein